LRDDPRVGGGDGGGLPHGGGAAPSIGAASGARRALDGLGGASSRRTAYRIALVAIVLVGIAVRLIGVASMSLWVDEAAIANVVSRGRWAAYVIYPASNRPFGYLVMSGWLAAARNSELALRASSLVPAVLGVPLMAVLARRLFRFPSFVLIATLSYALNGWLVTYAKDFKPYSAEQFLVLLWLVLFLRWQEGSAASLAVLAATMTISPLFGHASVFAIPLLAAAVAWECRRRETPRVALAFALCTAAALAIAVVQFRWVGRRTPPALFVGAPTYFNHARDGFVVGWWLRQGVDLLAAFVPIDHDVATSAPARGHVLLVLTLVGWLLGALRFAARREVPAALVLIGPIVAAMVLSALFPWPFGPERQNLYMVPLLTTTVLLGWEFALGGARAGPARLALVAAFAAVQMPTRVDAWTAKDTRFGSAQEEIVPALEAVARFARELDLQGPGESCLVFNQMSAYAVRYYAPGQQRLAPRVSALLVSHPHEFAPARSADAMQLVVERALASCDVVWVVLAHYGVGELDGVHVALGERDVATLDEQEFPGATLFAAARVPRP
jgi:hypothetical protein